MNKNLISVSGKKGSGKDTVANIINAFLHLKHKTNNDDLFWVVKEIITDSLILDINNNYKNVKWANKIKDTVCLCFGCTREQLEDRDFKEKLLGKEWKRYYATYVNGDNKTKVTPRIFKDERSVELWLSENSETPYRILEFGSELLSLRRIMQLLATDCGRNVIHENIWINLTMNGYTVDKKWLISDTRFPNEIEKVKEFNGICVNIVRSMTFIEWLDYFKEYVEIENFEANFFQKHKSQKITQNQFLEVLFSGYSLIKHKGYDDWYLGITHESETSLDDFDKWDVIIVNNGTLDELIKTVYNKLLLPQKII